jgi:nitrogen fixation protein NifU and related proteins
MAELRDLYQETVLDHYKKPRNFRRLTHANRQADGHNPLCGDKLSVFIQIENGVVQDISFIGAGCAISTASASMMTESLKGKTESQARTIYERFQQLMTNHSQSQVDPEDLGELAVFSGVREYPVRAKCAILAWHTLRAALEGTKETVETE